MELKDNAKVKKYLQERAKIAAKARWERTTPAQRKAHSVKMNKARTYGDYPQVSPE